MSSQKPCGVFVCESPLRLELVSMESDGLLLTRTIPLTVTEMTQIGLAMLLMAGGEVVRQAIAAQGGDQEAEGVPGIVDSVVH